MKSAKGNRVLVFVLIAILTLSVLCIVSPDVGTDSTLQENPLPRATFAVAATYTPGDYPSGLTLIHGDVLNGTSGGIFNVTGNFTIVSGATVTVVAGYKIVVYADNIIISGTLDCNGAGYIGGMGGSEFGTGTDGFCNPLSGAGAGGQFIGSGGGGGAYGSNGSIGAAVTGPGGAGGQEYGLEGLEGPTPNVSDIRLGAGGGGGGYGYDIISEEFYVGGSGGFGGGGVFLEASSSFAVNGAITCNGVTGNPGQPSPSFGGGGGGGGAGGGILLLGEHVSVSGTLSTLGGFGGIGGAGGSPSQKGGYGGVGGGGRIKLVYILSLNTTGSTITEGIGGTIYSFAADYIKPTLDLIDPMNGTIRRSGTPISMNISDLRGLQSVSYNWDDNANTTITLSNSSYALDTPLPSSDGEHDLEVFAQDDPGNWNYKRFTYITDDTSPIILLESPDNNSVHHSDAIIDISAFDLISLNHVLYNWDDFGYNQSIFEPYEILLPSGDGQHKLNLYANDTVDNWVSIVYYFVTDDTAPTSTSPSDISYTEGATGNGLSWVLTDANPEIYEIFLDSSPIESGFWVSGMEVSITVDGHVPGVYNYTMLTYDAANNQVTDTVVVTVLEVTTTTTITITTTTTTSTTTTTTTTTTSSVPIEPGMILVASIGIAVGIIVVLALVFMRRRS